MCGIFGMTYVDRERAVDRRTVAAATDLMSHRGPDDAGHWVRENVGLGHRRLSIIDLSPLGHQPMFNEDGSIALVYNGEIYNFAELCPPLCGKGHAFASKSDTEVIIHAYEEWGFDSLQKFNGMFAFALWDGKRRALWLVRDRLGVKPLYYYWDGEILVFASEIKPILKTGAVRPALNEEVLDAYFTLGYVPGPETMFRGIRKVMPGHYLLLEEGRLTDTEYWDFARTEETELPDGEYGILLEELLRDSIAKRLRSDVPLGVFLSGGIDSSAVVALMSDLAGGRIDTFTVGYDPARTFSEGGYAGMVAERFGTRHHVFQLEEDEFFASIGKLVQFAEEPIVEPAAIALYHLSKLARQSATVLLSGEGSDEILAGYYLYDVMGKIDRAQRFLPAGLIRLAGAVARLSGRVKNHKYADWLALPLEKRYQGTSGALTGSVKKELYTREFYETRGSYLPDTFSPLFDRVRHKGNPLAKMLYVDAKTWLVDDLLLKADKMTMAASIELRVPFLDYRLVELAASFPSRVKLSAGSGKAVLKAIMREKLPEAIVNREKMGFYVPTKPWIERDAPALLNAIERDADLKRWIRTAPIREELRRGRHPGDHAGLIMALLVLASWRDTFLSG